jgi:hypothetical protein
VNTTTTAGATSLYAANLGPNGLQLVHAYGSGQTFGLQVDEEPTQSTTATHGLVVHGAWALAAWESSALRHFSGLAVKPRDTQSGPPENPMRVRGVRGP